MILRRYLYREFVRSFFAVFVLLLLIVISSRFVSTLSDAVAGEIAADQVMQLLVLKLIASMNQLIPLCLYLAILMVIARMRQELETTAMATAGLGPGFFSGVAVRLSACFALLIAVLSFFIVPWAEGELNLLKAEAEERSDVIGLTAGRFREFSKGDRVMYAESLNDSRDQMGGVFLQVRQEQELAVLTSDAAHLQSDADSGDQFIVFTEGKRYQGRPGQRDFVITEYGEYGVRIGDSGASDSRQTLDAIATTTLWGQARADYRAELQWRLSVPISMVLLSALAMQLAFSGRADARYLTAITAILLYFTYTNLLGIAKSLLKKEQISAGLGLWWVHLLLLVILLAYAAWPRWRRYLRSRHSTHLLPAQPNQ